MPRSSLTKLRYELACIISNPKFGKKGGSWPSGIAQRLGVRCSARSKNERKKRKKKCLNFSGLNYLA